MNDTSPAPQESTPSSHEPRCIELAADVLSAGEARSWVRNTLTEWGYAGVAPEATLAVSELVTNAVIHAHSATRVALLDMDGAIQLRVADLEPEPPRVEHPDNSDVHGRGMMLVESVSESWGVEECPPGKVIWLDITNH